MVLREGGGCMSVVLDYYYLSDGIRFVKIRLFEECYGKETGHCSEGEERNRTFSWE